MAESINERIKAWRKQRGLSQAELAEKLGVSTQMISNLELGKKAIRPENLSKLCATLELSADFVLNGVDKNNVVDIITDKLLHLNEKELQLFFDKNPEFLQK